MEINVVNRNIKRTIHAQQGSSEVNPVVFFIPKTDAGVDLSACKFFVSIVDGQGYDKIPAPFTEESDTLQVQWDIESRTTAIEGNHPFQLVAENLEQEVVWLTNTSHVIVRESLHVDDPISGLLPSVLQAYQERMDQMESNTGETLQKAQEFAEQAGQYAQQTAQDKEATAADRHAMEEAQTELSEQIEDVKEELETAKDLVEQAKENAQTAQEAAQSTAADKEAVASTKMEIDAIKEGIDQQKQAVDSAIQTFTETTVPAAQKTVEEAGQTKVEEAKEHADSAENSKKEVEKTLSDANQLINDFSTITLPEALRNAQETLETAGQAKVDEAKGYADAAAGSAQEAGNSLSDVQEAVNAFTTVTLPGAVTEIESAGQEQITSIQQEGIAQVNAAKEQVELAKEQAGQSLSAAQEAKRTAEDLYDLLPLVTVSGNGSVEFPSCAAASLRECVIHGAHTQEGTPTPDDPLSPKFVGGSGNITVSITGTEPQTIHVPRPLVAENDYLNVTTGHGETTWKGIELTGTESWTKSGKSSVGGTVFYTTLPGQDTQDKTKEIFSTHFQQTKSAGSLVPGDIWMHNATFISMSNALLGITDSDNDKQKAEKFKNWLSAEKEAGCAVKVWYQPTEPQEIEISAVALTTGKGNVTLTVSGAEGEPAPDIQATAVQDWTMLKEEQKKKNQSYEERLNALEANVTGG